MLKKGAYILYACRTKMLDKSFSRHPSRKTNTNTFTSFHYIVLVWKQQFEGERERVNRKFRMTMQLQSLLYSGAGQVLVNDK